MRQKDSMEGITIHTPGPGACPTCYAKHEAQDPHDKNSLYYQYQFYRQHKRFPTWQDAMAHCSTMTQAVWREKLAKQGIAVEEGPDHEG